MTEKILFSRQGDWGVVTLNNDAALNALDWDMVKAMRAQLSTWADDTAVKAVLVNAVGEKAFCAGGDIRWLHVTAKKDPGYACEFFREEYRNNVLIHHFSKPYVAMIDGIVMGGGVGISMHGDYRVAGDRTLFAMPETGIGLFPDVGGGFFLPQLKDGLGAFYGLTGARAKAADCVAAGIATHYTPSDQYDDLEKALLAANLNGNAKVTIDSVLRQFAGDAGVAPVEGQKALIAQHFANFSTLQSLIHGLQVDGGDFAQAQLKTLGRMSPTSLLLTVEQLRRGSDLSFDDVMKMEFRMVRRVMDGPDFFEGVRAQIIDKDRNPKWTPAAIDDVSDGVIDSYFATLGDHELMLP